MTTPNNPNINNPNINYNAILVERHYIPVDIYMRMYNSQQNLNNNQANLYDRPVNYVTRQPVTTSRRLSERNSTIPQSTPGQSNTINPTTSRYNDLLSFFNIQSRNAENTTNTEPIQSRVITRSYETAGDMDQSFVNLLMTAFYAPETNTVEPSTRLTNAQIDAHSRVITYSASVDLDSPSCSICAQEWQHGDEIRKLNTCRHYFHKSCVDTWFRDHNTCPLCRTNIILSTRGSVDDVD